MQWSRDEPSSPQIVRRRACRAMLVSSPMLARVACLSPYEEESVRGWFKGRHRVEVVLVPDPPAQDAVFSAVSYALPLINLRRHKPSLARITLEGIVLRTP